MQFYANFLPSQDTTTKTGFLFHDDKSFSSSDHQKMKNKPGRSEKLASSDDPILDTCGLRNTFPENGWVPKTVDDYTSAYINKVSNPVVVAKDIIDKIKLVNSEMKIFCDWDENQIMQDAKDGFKNYIQHKPIRYRLYHCQ